jgi:hypothetical protein
VLRKISGSKRDEITEDWMGFLNEEFHDLYCEQNVIRVNKSKRMRWVGHVARIAEEERCIQGLGGNDGKRPLGRLRHGRGIILK